jgi:hypothetical protein
MKIYKVTLFIIDHDELGEGDISETLESTKYPNRCISPEVWEIESKEIGEWSDDHPLNQRSTDTGEFYSHLEKETS